MGWRAEGATWQSAEVAAVERPVRGTFLPKGGSQRGPVTAKRMGAVRDEFSSWHKSYFLNNSSLNTAVSSRYLKPLNMSCFSIIGLQVASCLQTILLFFGSPWEVWKDHSLLLLKLQGHRAQQKVLFRQFSLQQEQLKAPDTAVLSCRVPADGWKIFACFFFSPQMFTGCECVLLQQMITKWVAVIYSLYLHMFILL